MDPAVARGSSGHGSASTQWSCFALLGWQRRNWPSFAWLPFDVAEGQAAPMVAAGSDAGASTWLVTRWSLPTT